LRESEKIFKPFIYNIWNTAKQDNERKHFGAFPEVFMENLLYYHTNPLDIVFDPFGGGGTSVDVCRKMFRRYYVSDRKVIPGRENDIREWDILNGVPTDLQKPELVFLDPPYWKQAEGKYSNDSEDLGNMELDNFNESMRKLLKELSAWKVNQIAVVIQPTQYKNNWNWTDHIFHFDRMINDKYEILMRYILPYSTEQYLPQMVIKSKEEKKCLGSHRDLVIWKIR
jgi:DNA modification methylase